MRLSTSFLEAFFLLSYNPVGSVDMSPIGFQSQMFLVSQVQDLKVGVLEVRYQPFAPQQAALGFEFPPYYGSLNQLKFMSKLCLSFSYLIPYTSFPNVKELFSKFSGIFQRKFFYI